MAMVEVLIQIAGGPIYFPSQIPIRLTQGKTYPYNRMDGIIDYIRDEAVENAMRLKDVTVDSFKGTPGEPDKIYRIYGNDNSYYTQGTKDHKRPVIYRIVMVDTDKAWEIRYDEENGEYIHYFEEDEKYEITDRVLNYGKLVA